MVYLIKLNITKINQEPKKLRNKINLFSNMKEPFGPGKPTLSRMLNEIATEASFFKSLKYIIDVENLMKEAKIGRQFDIKSRKIKSAVNLGKVTSAVNLGKVI